MKSRNQIKYKYETTILPYKVPQLITQIEVDHKSSSLLSLASDWLLHQKIP